MLRGSRGLIHCKPYEMMYFHGNKCRRAGENGRVFRAVHFKLKFIISNKHVLHCADHHHHVLVTRRSKRTLPSDHRYQKLIYKFKKYPNAGE